MTEHVLTGRHEVMLGRHRVAIVVERAVRLLESPGMSVLARGDRQVALEPLEQAKERCNREPTATNPPAAAVPPPAAPSACGDSRVFLIEPL